jgi:hypothetical protein
MTRKPFEVFKRAREADCFRCYGDLVDHCASGYPPGNGGVQGYCEACRVVTFFDTAEQMEEANG